ncbi:MAG TPA: peroxiredoxin [Polyangiaceae bacterium]|jgi:peroxiredoxin Q/BCP
MLTEGDKAPAFELESDGGEKVSLKGSLESGKLVVLYFYPRDNTPGCTREAQAFTEAKRKLAAAGAMVLGVSKDSIKSHCGFRDKYALNFPLLSDPSLGVHKAYGAYGEKMMYGKKVEGTIRSTFLIGAGAKVLHVWRNVKVDGHVDAVLEAIREAKDGASKKKG